MNTESFTNLMEPSAPAIEHNDLVIDLNESQEKELQQIGITIIDGNYYMFQHFSSTEFSDVYIRCSKGLMVGQAEPSGMFHLIKCVI